MDLIVLLLSLLSGLPCSAFVNHILMLLPCFDLIYGLYGDPFFVLLMSWAKDLVGCLYLCLFPFIPYILYVWLLILLLTICQGMVFVAESNFNEGMWVLKEFDVVHWYCFGIVGSAWPQLSNDLTLHLPVCKLLHLAVNFGTFYQNKCSRSDSQWCDHVVLLCVYAGRWIHQ